jgi:hypothetical protein
LSSWHAAAISIASEQFSTFLKHVSPPGFQQIVIDFLHSSPQWLQFESSAPSEILLGPAEVITQRCFLQLSKHIDFRFFHEPRPEQNPFNTITIAADRLRPASQGGLQSAACNSQPSMLRLSISFEVSSDAEVNFVFRRPVFSQPYNVSVTGDSSTQNTVQPMMLETVWWQSSSADFAVRLPATITEAVNVEIVPLLKFEPIRPSLWFFRSIKLDFKASRIFQQPKTYRITT